MAGKFLNINVFYKEVDRRMSAANSSEHPLSALGTVKDFIMIHKNVYPENPELDKKIKGIYIRQGDILFGGNELSRSEQLYRKAGMSELEIKDHISLLRHS